MLYLQMAKVNEIPALYVGDFDVDPIQLKRTLFFLIAEATRIGVHLNSNGFSQSVVDGKVRGFFLSPEK